jgi:hypothetical protein
MSSFDQAAERGEEPLGLFALASMKVSKSVSETRHSLPILNPRRRPFRSHCVTVRSFI